MEFRENTPLDRSQVINAGSGGGRGGGGMAVGGLGGLILMVLALVLGINPGDVMNGRSADQGAPVPASANECKNTNDIKNNRECRWTAYVNSVQDYWATQFQPGQYRQAQTVSFSGAINTGCGAANSQVGPFYCPSDQRVYVDTNFVNKLLQMLGAQGGDAAEAYIIAHEYGHHIQTLTGQLQKVQSAGNQTGPTSPQVRLELQADCYAGVWMKNATANGSGIIKDVTQDDLNRVADAAEAVGDDLIQQSQAGRVSPEDWTHGSAKARHHWVGKGFQTGDPKVCEQTFTTDNLEG